MITVSSDLNYN